MYTEKNGEKWMTDALAKGETPAPSPKKLETRYEDLPYGRVFYANEDSKSGITVFYGKVRIRFRYFPVNEWNTDGPYVGYGPSESVSVWATVHEVNERLHGPARL